MTRKEIEQAIFEDICAASYPNSSKEDAVAHITRSKPIAYRLHKLEATRLYDEVIMRYVSHLPAN